MAQYNFKMALCEGRHEIKEAVDVTLWHFNRETGEYYPQEVR